MISVKNEKFNVNKMITKHSVLMLILCILALAVGVLFIIAPLRSAAVVIWIAFGILALIGLVGIFKFIFPGKGNKRDAFPFVFGILLVALFVVLLICALTCTASGTWDTIYGPVQYEGFAYFTAGMIGFFSIFFGCIALFNGIFDLCSVGNVEKGKRGWAVAYNIIQLILGILMIVFPFIYSWVAGILAGVYLLVISIFGMVLCGKAISFAKKAKKAGVDPTIEVTTVTVEKDEK